MVPALAIADILTERGYEVSFAGGPGGMEGTLVPKAGYPFDPVRIRGFTRKLGFSTLRTLGSLPVAAVDAWRVLRRLRPACVVGVGAYASGPVVAEAAVLGVPAVAVEMDAHLGVTNRILSHLVDRVCLGFPIPGLEGGKYVHTGRPIRPALLQATREEGLARFGLDPHRLTLLAFGGSLGARSVNSAMLQAFAGVETGFQIVHVTGGLDYGRVETELGRGGNPRYQVHAFLDDFPLALAAADIVVSRAGGSVAEILARGLPAVLIPYPLATADHQTKNARSLEEAGAALVIADAELDGSRLAAAVDELLPAGRRAAMGEVARSLARPDATTRIVEQIVELAGPPQT